jgi:hypothetical protein
MKKLNRAVYLVPLHDLLTQSFRNRFLATETNMQNEGKQRSMDVFSHSQSLWLCVCSRSCSPPYSMVLPNEDPMVLMMNVVSENVCVDDRRSSNLIFFVVQLLSITFSLRTFATGSYSL